MRRAASAINAEHPLGAWPPSLPPPPPPLLLRCCLLVKAQRRARGCLRQFQPSGRGRVPCKLLNLCSILPHNARHHATAASEPGCPQPPGERPLPGRLAGGSKRDWLRRAERRLLPAADQLRVSGAGAGLPPLPGTPPLLTAPCRLQALLPSQALSVSPLSCSKCHPVRVQHQGALLQLDRPRRALRARSGGEKGLRVAAAASEADVPPPAAPAPTIPSAQGCGDLGVDCCPGTPPYCRAPDTVCLPANLSAAADDQPDVPTKCQRMSAETCGQPGGLCRGDWASWPYGPVPACPKDKEVCPGG